VTGADMTKTNLADFFARNGAEHIDLANCIRALSIDAVEAANSGHPGAPMGEPRRVCRRLQLLSRMEHHEQDYKQVFP